MKMDWLNKNCEHLTEKRKNRTANKNTLHFTNFMTKHTNAYNKPKCNNKMDGTEWPILCR